jgi:hypothetical protein
MKSQDWLEFAFEKAHCDSEFAHFGLMLLLLFLVYSFADGVIGELAKKDDDQRRKEAERLKSTTLTESKISNPHKGASGKDFSELQKEEALK